MEDGSPDLKKVRFACDRALGVKLAGLFWLDFDHFGGTLDTAPQASEETKPTCLTNTRAGKAMMRLCMF